MESKTQQNLYEQQEREANVFALCLLMPEHIFVAAYKMLEWGSLTDNTYSKNIKRLADAFEVSENCVIARIQLLDGTTHFNTI